MALYRRRVSRAPQELLRRERIGTRAFPSSTKPGLRATVTEFGLHLPGAREGGRFGHGWRVVPSFLSEHYFTL